MSSEKIQELVEALKIPALVHFTRTENLPSILQHGLVSVSDMQERSLEATINDHLRLDGRLNGISTSIGFPNAPMFYKLRQENADADWCVLFISRRVLCKKDVLFCKHNAADARISCLSKNQLNSFEAFTDMYSEIEGHPTREEQKLKAFDPTDVQAEVLVMENIEPKYIFGVAFTSEAVRDAYTKILADRKTMTRKPPKGYFATRTYHRTWG